MDDRSQPTQSLQEMLGAEELEQLRLRNQRLRLKLSAHGRGRRWYSVSPELAPIITALVALGGLGFGLVQYGREQDKNRAEQRQQSDREQSTAEREFMKPWLEAQREIYRKALNAAATIANPEDSKTKRQSTEDFWRLYQGEMILVETKTVSGAMVQFGHCLDGSDTCNTAELNNRCRALASAMGTSMAATAKMTYREFAENQFRYSSGN